MVNYKTLKQELQRDPQEFGYAKMTPELVARTLNDKQFYQTEFPSHRDNDARPVNPWGVMYVTSKIAETASFSFSVNTQVRRSRAELLFGPGIEITEEDVELALMA